VICLTQPSVEMPVRPEVKSKCSEEKVRASLGSRRRSRDSVVEGDDRDQYCCCFCRLDTAWASVGLPLIGPTAVVYSRLWDFLYMPDVYIFLQVN